MTDDVQTRGYLPSAAEGGTVASLVGFYFSFRVAIEFLAVKLFGVDPSVGSAAVIGLGFFLLFLVFLCSFGAKTVPLRSILRIGPVRWSCVFLAFAFASLGWSVTVSPLTSFVYWCGLASDVALVLMLVRTNQVERVSAPLLKGFVFGACCIAALGWIVPAQVDLRLGDEEFFNSNQIGNLCAFAVLIAQYLMHTRKGKWGGAAIFLGITLVRSLSKTTIAAFLVGEGILLIRDRAMSRKSKMLLISSAVIVLLLFWGLFEAYYNIYTTTGNQAETLTGRTAIWAYVVDGATQNPWIGHGFDSMWKVVPPFGSDKFEARHAENELLQQFYTYGVAGIMMLAAIYGSLWKQIRRLPRGSMRILFTSMLLFFLVRGLAEAEPFDLLLPLWSIVLFGLVIETRVQSLARLRNGGASLSVRPESPRFTSVPLGWTNSLAPPRLE